MTRTKVLRHLFRVHGFRESLKIASVGVLYLVRFHRNMRIIFLFGLAAFLFGVFLKLKGMELAILCITITVVFICEIFNTSIELLMNILSTRYHIRIKLIKDISAAIVLLSCLNALAVGYILFVPKVLKLICPL